MVKDIKYIIKRILIGVGICFILSLIRGNLFIMANAQTYNFSSYELCGQAGYGCTSGGLPISHTYGESAYSYRASINLVNTHTYSISYYAVVSVDDFNLIQGYPVMFVSYNNNNSIRAYPDRYATINVAYIGYDRYAITWDFELDVVGNFNLVDVSFNFTGDYTNGNTFATFLESNIDVVDITSSGSSSNQDIINNDNSNTQSIINNQNRNNQNIINNNINNTENIINNQNQNNQSIINNQNNNTQDIIDNQNQNAEDTQNVIKEQFENCIDEQVVYPEFANVILNIGSGYQGVALNNNNSGGVLDISKYVGETITISFSNLDSSHSSRTNYCFIDSAATSTRKSCISYRISGTTSTSNTFTVTVPDKAKYLYLVGYNNYIDTTWVNNVSISLPKVCSNHLTDINDSLNDDSGVNDSDIDDLFGDIRGNSSSPVSDLFTLPITLLQAYLDGMSGTCSPYTLGTLFGTSLVLPCIDIPGIIGTSLWNVIDALFCLYMIYNIAMMCIDIYESYTSLDDAVQLLYSPQHANSRVSQRGGTYDG